MILSEVLKIKLSDILAEDNWDDELDNFADDNHNTIIRSQHEWNAGVASLEKLLSLMIEKNENKLIQGIVISSPTPMIKDVKLVSQLETVVFSSFHEEKMALMPCDFKNKIQPISRLSFIDVSLDINDILNKEQFCLVLTSKFTCLILKSINKNHNSKFQFSFTPEIIKKVWLLLKERMIISQNYHTEYLDKLVNKFISINPNYKIITEFTRYLLKELEKIKLVEINQIPRQSQSISLKKTPLPPYPEFELLQALTHEIRTPLTTIKTTTKLLLKRAKLTPDIVKSLELIEQECIEQINRMELIFRAAELESKPIKQEQVKLISTSLEEILNQTIPTWKKQAQRRNIILDIIIPHKLPQIVSDPAILTQILGGLMEKFIRNLPSGGNFQVLILPAGNQLKLQFLSESNFNNDHVKCLGKLLLFQPETGSLSLSYDVTKNIFHALGGKLTMKQTQDKGEILTIFLPLGNSKNCINQAI
ncbi:MAG: HAMP domain-containing histidine kinase [Cyanobacteria bacterium]|nr:HAMP domain-containing histidine kinase [Cyanobacteria bacterium CG_2015-16_32_12]NCO76939.1 HAMP domain-containing histidine kinase [Cyanobacteria bacterium CG_2015-22_32_23]NCQ05892.1 HAMP domain-containing histidine kinase [Cyanobacteria bacterium CG_2015-09_32_10]NCQ43165.1 HAMP domain-containing histidine kinase [Cyanobacteria bacterium CG_2015-04_32_10]NCS84973.1 HAMP domain-containing histidine kinase [Cyanobacteria bacterium CG_2015-02_32_10]